MSVRMSVAVLACWRPISQMIFATIKKCGGMKWRFHIQQGKGGFTWGWVAAAGVGGETLLLDWSPWLAPCPCAPPPKSSINSPDLQSLCGLLPGLLSQLCAAACSALFSPPAHPPSLRLSSLHTFSVPASLCTPPSVSSPFLCFVLRVHLERALSLSSLPF